MKVCSLSLDLADALDPAHDADTSDGLVRQLVALQHEDERRQARELVGRLPARQRGMFSRLVREWELPPDLLLQLFDATTAGDLGAFMARYAAMRDQLPPRAQAALDEWLDLFRRLLPRRGSAVVTEGMRRRALSASYAIVHGRRRHRFAPCRSPGASPQGERGSPTLRALIHQTDPAPPRPSTGCRVRPVPRPWEVVAATEL